MCFSSEKHSRLECTILYQWVRMFTDEIERVFFCRRVRALTTCSSDYLKNKFKEKISLNLYRVYFQLPKYKPAQ